MVNAKIISLPLFFFTTTTSFLSFSHITLYTPNSSIPNPNSPISLYIQNQTPPSSFRSPKTQFLSRLSSLWVLLPLSKGLRFLYSFGILLRAQFLKDFRHYWSTWLALFFFFILHALISGGLTRTGL